MAGGQLGESERTKRRRSPSPLINPLQIKEHICLPPTLIPPFFSQKHSKDGPQKLYDNRCTSSMLHLFNRCHTVNLRQGLALCCTKRTFSGLPIPTDPSQLTLVENNFWNPDKKVPTPAEQEMLKRRWDKIDRYEKQIAEMKLKQEIAKRQEEDRRAKKIVASSSHVKRTKTQEGTTLMEELDQFLSGHTASGSPIFAEHMRAELRALIVAKLEKALKTNPTLPKEKINELVFDLAIDRGFRLANNEEERLRIICPTSPEIHEEVVVPGVKDHGIVCYRHMSFEGFGPTLRAYLTLGLNFPSHGTHVIDHSFLLECGQLEDVYLLYKERLGICSPSDKAFIEGARKAGEGKRQVQAIPIPKDAISISPSLYEGEVRMGEDGQVVQTYKCPLQAASERQLLEAAKRDPAYLPYLHPLQQQQLKAQLSKQTADRSDRSDKSDTDSVNSKQSKKPPGYPDPATIRVSVQS
eukprot:g51233.t1